MSVMCLLLAASVCTAGDGLDEARSLLQKGLLRQAEQRLAPLLADELDAQRRARVLLLLGNVNYERGHYARALDQYVQAERNAADQSSFVAAVRGNRILAEQRLARSRDVAKVATRLLSAVAATLFLAGVAVAWLVRQSRTGEPATSGTC